MNLWIIKSEEEAICRLFIQESTGKLPLMITPYFTLKNTLVISKIKLDKGENSAEAYHRIKSMCEGIKTVIAQ